MKKIVIVLVALVLSTGAMAQHHGGGFGGHYGGGYGGGFYGPGVGLSFGYPFYSPYYYPYGYPYGYYPYGGPYYGNSPSENKLAIKIDEINSKYDYKKSLVKHDKGLTHRQKRIEKKALKYEREQAISQAKEDYYNNKLDKK